MGHTDYTLLKKIKTGDRPAFMTLYERYWDGLYRFIFSRTKDREVTEEILQNLWIKILEDADSILTDDLGNAKGYLLKYLHYRIIDHFNSQKKNNSSSLEESDPDFDISETEYFEILEDHDISLLFSMIDQVVAQLSSTEQKIYDMRMRQNMSVNETAEALGLSNKTVSNKLSKTLNEIREQLSPEYQSSKKFVSIMLMMEILLEY